jgi:hypothetical protein
MASQRTRLLPVILRLGAGSAVGQLIYPGIGCTATVTVTRPLPTDREVHLVETASFDRGRLCAPTAAITLDRNGTGRISYYSRAATMSDNVATAALSPA